MWRSLTFICRLAQPPILSYNSPSGVQNPGNPLPWAHALQPAHAGGERWSRHPSLVIAAEQIRLFLWSVLRALRPSASPLGVQHKPTRCTRNPQPWRLFLIAEGSHDHKWSKQELLFTDEETQAKPSDLWYSHLAILFGQVHFPGNPSASAELNFNKCNPLPCWTNVWNSPWVLLPHAPAIMNTKAYFSDLNLLKI